MTETLEMFISVWTVFVTSSSIIEKQHSSFLFLNSDIFQYLYNILLLIEFYS